MSRRPTMPVARRAEGEGAASRAEGEVPATGPARAGAAPGAPARATPPRAASVRERPREAGGGSPRERRRDARAPGERPRDAGAPLDAAAARPRPGEPRRPRPGGADVPGRPVPPRAPRERTAGAAAEARARRDGEPRRPLGRHLLGRRLLGRRRRASAGVTDGAPGRAALTRVGRAAAPSAGSVVSLSSARRFARRARARRLLAWRPVLAVLGVGAVVAALTWVVLESSLLVVDRVEVVGAQRQDADQVRSAVAGAVGVQLARVDTGDIERRVAALPVVRTAEAVRVWPSTLEVRLVERVPVAAVPDVTGFVLVDRTGAPVVARAEPPGDLPVVEVNLRIAAPGTLPAVLQVMDDLPSALRADVERVGATSPDSVSMQLRGGQSVVWGGPDDAALKARVLDVLLTQEAEVYDVSSPRTPVTR